MSERCDSGFGTGLHVLVVEDHDLVRHFLAVVLGQAGYHVTVTENGDSALQLLGGGLQPDLVLSDIRMPGATDGIPLARAVRSQQPRAVILLQTGYSETRADEFRVLQKPYSPDVLLAAIEDALRGRSGA